MPDLVLQRSATPPDERAPAAPPMPLPPSGRPAGARSIRYNQPSDSRPTSPPDPPAETGPPLPGQPDADLPAKQQEEDCRWMLQPHMITEDALLARFAEFPWMAGAELAGLADLFEKWCALSGPGRRARRRCGFSRTAPVPPLQS